MTRTRRPKHHGDLDGFAGAIVWLGVALLGVAVLVRTAIDMTT